MDRKVRLVVGGVRAAGALVETVPIKLRKNSDGDLAGSATIDVTDPVSLVVSMADEPGADFAIEITVETLGSASRKGTLDDDLVVRKYSIKFDGFE